MALLEVRDLTWTPNGMPILDHLSMEVQAGRVHAVVGPNGAGKSTLAFAIMGLAGYRDVEGEIVFDGKPIGRLAVDERARRGITLGWQEPARFEGITVETYLRVAARNGGDVKPAELLRRVGLAPLRYLSRAVDKSLSGGERKKIELASLLAARPRLVLLDEPDSGIDVDSLGRIREAIGQLKDAGSTVLLITHSHEVLGWAQHAFLMCCGHILDQGPVEQIGEYFRSRCIPCDHKNRPTIEEGLDDRQP
jgi:Fe-S cluster assembly ATP-binding protein